MTISMNAQGSFPCADVFACAMSFLDASDFFNAASVCQQWKQFADELSGNQSLWKMYSENKGIPMVCNEGGTRNCRSDFRVIYPVTSVSGEMYRKIFGEPEGEVPNISVEIFDRLSQPDPFDRTKFQRETWQLIVEYPFVHRVLGPAFLHKLEGTDGSISAFETEDAELIATRIPFTLRNRVMLLTCPLIKSENEPLIQGIDRFTIPQNDYCPVRVNVFFQRRLIVEGTRTLSYPDQEAFVMQLGLKVMPFGLRLLSDAVEIYALGTCPDKDERLANTSTLTFFRGGVYNVTLNAKEAGVTGTIFLLEGQCAGVAVGVPAEAKL